LIRIVCFDDLFNLVTDPSFLVIAGERVKRTKGARSAGIDDRTAASVLERIGAEDSLTELRPVAVRHFPFAALGDGRSLSLFGPSTSVPVKADGLAYIQPRG
jgi:hypothetical protein